MADAHPNVNFIVRFGFSPPGWQRPGAQEEADEDLWSDESSSDGDASELQMAAKDFEEQEHNDQGEAEDRDEDSDVLDRQADKTGTCWEKKDEDVVMAQQREEWIQSMGMTAPTPAETRSFDACGKMGKFDDDLSDDVSTCAGTFESNDLEDDDFKPVFISGDQRVPFPAPTKGVRPPRVQSSGQKQFSHFHSMRRAHFA